MLPQQRLAALRGVEEVRAVLPVHPQQKEGQADRGDHEKIGHAGCERAPDQDRHLAQGHSGRTGSHRRDEEIGGAYGCGNSEEHHAQCVEVLVEPRVVGARGIGHVIEPAIVRSIAGEETRVQEKAAREVNPVAERIQPRKRHVTAAEQERPEIVGEAGENRRRVQEDHCHPVRRKEVVVLFRRKQRTVRAGELHAHHERLDPAYREECERGDDVANADLLVIDAREESLQPACRFPQLEQPRLMGDAVRSDARRAVVGLPHRRSSR